MITQWLLDAVCGLLGSLFGLVPVWELAELDVSQFAEVASSTARVFDAYVPLGLVVTCTLLMSAVRLALALWDFILFVYHQFWGSS